MNIDLLFTSTGEAGLLASRNFFKKISGAVFDAESGHLTLEYSDMDFIELNIPIESEYNATLDMCPIIHLGAVHNGTIAQAYQVPFMFLDDPYRMEAFKDMTPPSNPLLAFDYFIKACVFGQPVHREDLGDENAMGCILGEAAPSSLQFEPQLARRAALEAGPRIVPQGPAGPGLGGGGRSSYSGGTYGNSRAGQIRTQGGRYGDDKKGGGDKKGRS